MIRLGLGLRLRRMLRLPLRLMPRLRLSSGSACA